MSLFLTRDELMEMSGCKRRDRTAAWFAQNGYRFDIAADGWPRVLRAAVEAKLMPAQSRRQTKTEPDFSIYGTPPKAA